MSDFVDRLLVRFSNSAQLRQELVPAADTTFTRLRALLSAVYDFPFARIHTVSDVQVRRIEMQRPLFPPGRRSGTWTQTIPGYTRTDVAYEYLEGLQPTWLDVSAEVAVTAVVEADAGEVDSVLTRDVTNFTTLNQFRAHFRFFDLDEFMARHRITTVQDLKKAYQYVLTEIKLKAPPAFDPSDAANERRYTLNVAVLIRDAIDVAAALRDAKLAQTAVERTLTFRREAQEAEVRTPFAPIVIFPQAALAGLPFNAAALQTFFAGERILALFMTP